MNNTIMVASMIAIVLIFTIALTLAHSLGTLP
jgi:hypothetical protein